MGCWGSGRSRGVEVVFGEEGLEVGESGGFGRGQVAEMAVGIAVVEGAFDGDGGARGGGTREGFGEGGSCGRGGPVGGGGHGGA